MLNVRVLLTLELMWLNHLWWATDGIHCRKKPYGICGLKWQGIQFATCGVILLLLFSCQTSLSACIHSEKSAYLSRFPSTVKITCMRTDYGQNTCQTLKFQSEQQVTPFFLPRLHRAAAEGSCCHTSGPGGPGAECLGLGEWPSCW